MTSASITVQGLLEGTAGAEVALPAEYRLLARVSARCESVMREACRQSSVPVEFLAALTANESGGNALAARFEPAVYTRLQSLFSAKRKAWGGMRTADLHLELREMFRTRGTARHAFPIARLLASDRAASLAALPDACLRDLATSWGPTQIMGYQMVNRRGTVRDLLDLPAHYRIALELLSEFADRFQIDVSHEFEPLFRCWNTGQPDGRTVDPAYVEIGLRRIELYRQMLDGRAIAELILREASAPNG